VKIFFLLILSVISFSRASSQKEIFNDIPDQVASAFRVKYPSAIAKKWAVKNNIYTVRFIKDDINSTATFNATGVWKSTETTISSTRKLRLSVKNGYYKSRFGSWYIEKMERIELPGKSSYKFAINNGNLLDGDHHDAFLEQYVLQFDGNGTLISATVLK
jgi:hypothetical protein